MKDRGYIKFRRAFTLAELLVVLALIGVIAAIVAPSFARAHAYSERLRMARTLPNDVITNIVGIAVSTINPEDYQIWTDSGSALNPPRNLLYREIVSAGTYYTVRHVQVVCNPSDTIRVTFKITNNEACATIHIHSLKDISGVNWFEPR